jgi:hypothetical protein
LADVVFLLWDAAFEFTSLHFTLQLNPPQSMSRAFLTSIVSV